MTHRLPLWLLGLLLLSPAMTLAQAPDQAPRVVDLPTRPGVTQRFLLIVPREAKAVAILLTGGDGVVGLTADGMVQRNGNFLVRSRDLFAAQGLAVAVVDTPSDRANLDSFRQTPQHVSDVKAVIAWLRQELKLPVWLVGTSRGTQSAAYVATHLPPAAGGADGLVLTSTILSDRRGGAVPDMAIDGLTVPVLVVHHRRDGCGSCRPADLPRLTAKLTHATRTDTLLFDGGNDVGDPCGSRAHHGYNGIEAEVTRRIAAWMLGGTAPAEPAATPPSGTLP